MVSPLAAILMQAKAAAELGEELRPQITQQPREDITTYLACWNMLNTSLFSLF